MNYTEYFSKCRDVYQGEQRDSVSEFYSNPVKRIPIETFSKSYMESVRDVSSKVKSYFDDHPTDDIITYYPNFLDFESQIETMCGDLVPWLEENTYGCNLFVDKIYIYRTSEISKRKSSYIWHYDNNPIEIVKNIIYLNDVDLQNSPFEYLMSNEGRGVLFPATRKGPNEWGSAPNNSRVDDLVSDMVSNGTHRPFKVLGPIGTTYSFNNDAAHRVNPVESGYRDVINIRVKPTTTKPPKYVSEMWTTDNRVSGVVNPDPEKDWEYYSK